MGYEPITNCAYCNEAADVYTPGFWLCEGCAEAEENDQLRWETERAEYLEDR